MPSPSRLLFSSGSGSFFSRTPFPFPLPPLGSRISSPPLSQQQQRQGQRQQRCYVATNPDPNPNRNRTEAGSKSNRSDTPMPAPTPSPNVSEEPKDAVSSSTLGDQQTQQTQEEVLESAERQREMQAPNRRSVWSRSQERREVAMRGPRFEQTIMEVQVCGSGFSFLRH